MSSLNNLPLIIANNIIANKKKSWIDEDCNSLIAEQTLHFYLLLFNVSKVESLIHKMIRLFVYDNFRREVQMRLCEINY